LVHIIVALFFFTSLFQIPTLQAQFSIKHTSTVTKLLIDNSGRSFLLDAKNDLYEIKNRKLEHIKSLPADYKAVQLEEKILFFDATKVYTFDNLEIKEIILSKEKIEAVKYEEGFHVVCSESNLQFWNQDTSFVCPISLSTNERILDVWIDRGKKYLMTSLGVRELCLQNGLEYIISKEGMLPNCAESKEHDEVFVGSKQTGIWTYKNETFKQFYIPGIDFPKAIKNLKIKDEVLWILSEDKKLSRFNLETQVLDKVQDEVDNFDLDKWKIQDILRILKSSMNTNWIKKIGLKQERK